MKTLLKIYYSRTKKYYSLSLCNLINPLQNFMVIVYLLLYHRSLREGMEVHRVDIIRSYRQSINFMQIAYTV